MLGLLLRQFRPQIARHFRCLFARVVRVSSQNRLYQQLCILRNNAAFDADDNLVPVPVFLTIDSHTELAKYLSAFRDRVSSRGVIWLHLLPKLRPERSFPLLASHRTAFRQAVPLSPANAGSAIEATMLQCRPAAMLCRAQRAAMQRGRAIADNGEAALSVLCRAESQRLGR